MGFCFLDDFVSFHHYHLNVLFYCLNFKLLYKFLSTWHSLSSSHTSHCSLLYISLSLLSPPFISLLTLPPSLPLSTFISLFLLFPLPFGILESPPPPPSLLARYRGVGIFCQQLGWVWIFQSWFYGFLVFWDGYGPQGCQVLVTEKCQTLF